MTVSFLFENQIWRWLPIKFCMTAIGNNDLQEQRKQTVSINSIVIKKTILYLNTIGFKAQSLWGHVQIKFNQIKFNQIQDFKERGKPEYPGKNLPVQRTEPTNSFWLTHYILDLFLGQSQTAVRWNVCFLWSTRGQISFYLLCSR